MAFLKASGWVLNVSPVAIPGMKVATTRYPSAAMLEQNIKVSIKYKFIFGIIATLLLVTLMLTSCTGGSLSCATAIARGWAGGTVSDGTIFIASMKGKIVALDATGDQLKSIGTSTQLTVQTSSGLLGCSSSSSPLAIYASPVVADATVTDTADPDYGLVYQVVYVAGTDGKIYAYAFKKGAWSTVAEYIYPRQGTVNATIIGDIILDNNTIYYALSDGTVNALNAKDLTFKWSYKIKSKIWSAPAINGSTLYIGSFNKTVYALNTADGSEKWTYITDGAINSTSVVYNNTVYIGDYSRHFYALNAATGEMVWKFPTDDTGAGNPKNFFWAKPVVLNGVIYAANLDGNIYALDSSTGKLVKTYTLGYSISSSPVVVGNYIVVATSVASYAPTKQKENVYIIDTTNGSKKALDISPNEAINAPLFAYGNTVYIHTVKDNLYEIDTVTKTIKQSPPFSLASETYP